jgi:hypothetical protein
MGLVEDGGRVQREGAKHSPDQAFLLCAITQYLVQHPP